MNVHAPLTFRRRRWTQLSRHVCVFCRDVGNVDVAVLDSRSIKLPCTFSTRLITSHFPCVQGHWPRGRGGAGQQPGRLHLPDADGAGAGRIAELFAALVRATNKQMVQVLVAAAQLCFVVECGWLLSAPACKLAGRRWGRCMQPLLTMPLACLPSSCLPSCKRRSAGSTPASCLT